MTVSSETSHQDRRIRSRVASFVGLVAVFFIADKILGVVRDLLVGRAFGASAELDAYYAAFELPDLLFTVVAGSAMATALIPVLSARIAKDDSESTWRLVSAVVNWALLIVALISIVAAFFAPQIIRLVARGFDAEQVALGARLMRLVLLQTLISSVSGILMSVLQAHQSFLFPAMAPLSYTLGRILGLQLLAPQLGVFGLAWGGVAGTVGHLLIQLYGLSRHRPRWRAVLRHPDLRPLVRLMGPRVLGLGATYINFVLPTVFGSFLFDGAISSYEYAWRLMQFPETIIGTTLGLTVFPTLAEIANAGDRDQLRRTTSWALRLVLALAVPAAVGLVVLGRPLTALLFQRGEFGETATTWVYMALRFLSIGLVAHSALEVVSRLFYARRDMWTPLWAALGGLLTNVAAGALLLPLLSHQAIAVGNSLGVLLQVVWLALVAVRRMEAIELGRVVDSLWRIGLASAVMGGLVLGFRALPFASGPLIGGLGGLVIGALGYLAVALLVRVEAIGDLLSELWSWVKPLIDHMD